MHILSVYSSFRTLEYVCRLFKSFLWYFTVTYYHNIYTL